MMDTDNTTCDVCKLCGAHSVISLSGLETVHWEGHTGTVLERIKHCGHCGDYVDYEDSRLNKKAIQEFREHAQKESPEAERGATRAGS
jgi:ferredoxin